VIRIIGANVHVVVGSSEEQEPFAIGFLRQPVYVGNAVYHVLSLFCVVQVSRLDFVRFEYLVVRLEQMVVLFHWHVLHFGQSLVG
jgi:hypothetical protein